MDFSLPAEITAKLAELDAFIEAEIKPLEREHPQFFDHRRENARTDWDDDGRPRQGMARADRGDGAPRRPGRPPAPGPAEDVPGGGGASNLMIAAIREHPGRQGLGLHNDLQDESSVVGNFPIVPVIADYGTPEQKRYIEGIITGKMHLSFGLTEPATAATPPGWKPPACPRPTAAATGSERHEALEQPGLARARQPDLRAHQRQTGRSEGHHRLHRAHRVAGAQGSSTTTGPSTCRPTTPRPELKNVRVPASAILHKEGEGLVCAQRFVHENRIRQAAASAGAARYCIEQAVKYAKGPRGLRRTAGEEAGHPVAAGGALRRERDAAQLHLQTAWQMDRQNPLEISDMVSICNFRANRLVCRSGRLGDGCTAAWATAATCPSSTSTATTAATASPEGSEECRSGAWRNTCSASRAEGDAGVSEGRRAVDFDVAALEDWLRGWLGPDAAPLSVRRTEGGMSNPTYFLARRLARGAAHKQPPGVVLPSAHAVDRQFRVLQALHGSAQCRCRARCASAPNARWWAPFLPDGRGAGAG